MPVGAAPVVVFVNTQAPTTDGLFHFGNANVTNIDRFTLAGYLNGSITSTTALATTHDATDAAAAPVHVFLREPLSGTYNTMEFNIPASKEIATSQEIGVDPTTYKGTTADANGNIGNPMNITVKKTNISTLGTVNSAGIMEGLVNSSRQRAIGTGDMVNVVAYTTGCTIVDGAAIPTGCVGADKLGYAFWGYGNFSYGAKGAAVTTKYLTVDGVDPLYSAANPNPVATGVFPYCDATNFSAGETCPPVPMDNIKNGSYPIWTMYRVVTKLPVPTLVQQLVTKAQDNSVVGVVRDFVPANQLTVFRSHYTQAGIAPSNGHISVKGVVAETGGDVGGAVYQVQADYNHILDYGKEILNVKQ